jgi:hypothetical protein
MSLLPEAREQVRGAEESGMLVALSLSGLCAFCVVQTGPISNLVSSYTPGEQLSLEVTPDAVWPNARRGFLAEGATIAVLNLQVTPPVLIDTHPVPMCQPLALRYYHHVEVSGASDYLFIAGGALGVWRLTLCSNLFAASPTACLPSSTYADLLVQSPIENGFFERKRCVDVEIL